MLVHIIADYGTGDLAFAEVIQRIKVHLPDAEPMPLPVPAFSTLVDRSLSPWRKCLGAVWTASDRLVHYH